MMLLLRRHPICHFLVNVLFPWLSEMYPSPASLCGPVLLSLSLSPQKQQGELPWSPTFTPSVTHHPPDISLTSNVIPLITFSHLHPIPPSTEATPSRTPWFPHPFPPKPPSPQVLSLIIAGDVTLFLIPPRSTPSRDPRQSFRVRHTVGSYAPPLTSSTVFVVPNVGSCTLVSPTFTHSKQTIKNEHYHKVNWHFTSTFQLLIMTQ